jgi:hypothetical protein
MVVSASQLHDFIATGKEVISKLGKQSGDSVRFD